MNDLTVLCVFFCGFAVGAFALLCLMGLVAANIDEETLSALKEFSEENEK